MRSSLVLLAMAIPLPMRSQETLWPAPRGAHVMAYHDRLRQTVLLGGLATDSALWGWDGDRWRVLATGGPAGRAHFAMAYDGARDRLVVHGGVRAVFGNVTPDRFGDTWLWDGRRWQRVDGAGPAVRDHHAMAWDPARRQLVLFGGADSSGSMLADTWGWDGRGWRKLADGGPPGRSAHRLAFDARRGVMVMFGGWGADGLLNDTWEWDGATWRQVQTSSAPGVRFATRMAYDIRRARTVLFGGRSGNSNLSDTWEYDGRTWTRSDVAGPTQRNIHEMVYDRRAGAVVLFGGFNAPVNHSDLWLHDGTWRQAPRPDAAPSTGTYTQPGPFAVGYRVINHWDSTRAPGPSFDFEGRPVSTPPATPVQVSVWYPASGGGTPMKFWEYRAISTKRESLAPVSDADRPGTASELRQMAPILLGVELPGRLADSIIMTATAAQRDATPAPGRFPLVVGGLEAPNAAFGLAEYLASHGYVVVTSPSLPRTAGQQATRPAIALETQTRNIEVVQGLARGFPFVDPARVAVIGLNFDGMAALNYQMRNMSAAAIVSIDGWELKAQTSAALRDSPWYAPSRMRVPYLGFSQDNAPPGLAFNDTVFRALTYAPRSVYVVRDMEHSQLVSNQLVFPFLTAERRLGYDFVWKTVRTFLDAHLKLDTVARAALARTAPQNGYPAWLVELERNDAAFAAIPTEDEVERIAMSGEVERLAAIFRRARADDATVHVVPVPLLNLYAFRFLRRDPAKSVAFNQLAAEMYPRSTAAANNLGNSYRDTGDMPKAVEWWQRALTLIDADPDLLPADRQPSRTTIEGKIRQARSGSESEL